MHELGVVVRIVKDLNEVAQEQNIGEIRKVTISLGEVSTVIPEYLIDCWNWARKRDPLLTECELLIERIPAITYCDGCGKTYETVKHARICPHCGSDKTWLLQGNEFRIKEIEVPEDAPETLATV